MEHNMGVSLIGVRQTVTRQNMLRRLKRFRDNKNLVKLVYYWMDEEGPMDGADIQHAGWIRNVKISRTVTTRYDRECYRIVLQMDIGDESPIEDILYIATDARFYGDYRSDAMCIIWSSGCGPDCILEIQQ